MSRFESITIREVESSDLETFYEHQSTVLDEDGMHSSVQRHGVTRRLSTPIGIKFCILITT